MAEHGAEHFRERVADSTPVDDSPSPSRPPGTARRSWRVKPVLGPLVTGSAEVYETGIETHDHLARLLEYGTGTHGPHHRPYLIRGDTLRYYSRRLGRWVFRRDVLNPGQPRPHATAIAIARGVLWTPLTCKAASARSPANPNPMNGSLAKRLLNGC